LPAATLADVGFTPALPEDQWHAIRSLRYGCATKVIIQTRQNPFRGRARAFATEMPLGAFWDGGEEQIATLKFQTPGGKSQPPSRRSQLPGRWVLTFLAGGSASKTLQARAARGASAVLADLCWLGLAGAPVDTIHSVTWEDDPFARGGYAYLDPGFDPAWRKLLGRRAGRLVFAGEHTSTRWQGYMNGAVESALRAVDELVNTTAAVSNLR